MEKFPVEIKEFDLCRIDGKFYEIRRVSDWMAKECFALTRYFGVLVIYDFDCDNWCNNHVMAVKDYHEFITNVYRLIGKDYICIFER